MNSITEIWNPPNAKQNTMETLYDTYMRLLNTTDAGTNSAAGGRASPDH